MSYVSITRNFAWTSILLWCCSCTAPGVLEEKDSVAPALPDQFSSSGQQEVTHQWWASFEEEELNTLVELALADNLELKTAFARLSEAQALARVTASDQFPEIDGRFQARREGGDTNREFGGTEEDDRFFAGISAGYELDLWGRLGALSDADILRAQATRQEVQVVALSLSAETALAWVDGLTARGGVQLLQSQVKDNQSRLNLLQNRFRSGQAERVDVLRQEQLLLETQRLLTGVEAEIRLVQHRLAVLVGRTPDQLPDLQGSQLPGVPSLPDTGVPLETLEQRPDVRAAWYRLQASDRDVAAAVSNRLPRISITASLGSETGEISDLFRDWLWTLAGNLTAPLLDGGGRRAEVDQEQAVLEQRLAEYGQTLLVAVREVEDALVREQQQADRVRDLMRERDLADETLTQLRLSYQNGVINFLDVLAARTQLQELEREVLTARRDRLRFRIALYRALAGDVHLEEPSHDKQL